MVLLSDAAPIQLSGKLSTFKEAQHNINDHMEQLLQKFVAESMEADAKGAADFEAGRYMKLEQFSARIHGG